MARERLLALRERRARLVVQAEQERVAMLAVIERAERAAIWFDRGAALLRRLRANPQWVAAGVALLVIVRPRRALKWLAVALSLWRTWHSLRPLAERLGLVSSQPPAARGAR